MRIHFTTLLVMLAVALNAQSYYQNLFDEMGYDKSGG